MVVFGRSTCPFCIEVTRTLATDMGLSFPYYQGARVECVGGVGADGGGQQRAYLMGRPQG